MEETSLSMSILKFRPYPFSGSGGRGVVQGEGPIGTGVAGAWIIGDSCPTEGVRVSWDTGPVPGRGCASAGVGVDSLGEPGVMVKASSEAEGYGALKRVSFIAGLMRLIAIMFPHGLGTFSWQRLLEDFLTDFLTDFGVGLGIGNIILELGDV
jgi:hypothetical protein